MSIPKTNENWQPVKTIPRDGRYVIIIASEPLKKEAGGLLDWATARPFIAFWEAGTWRVQSAWAPLLEDIDCRIIGWAPIPMLDKPGIRALSIGHEALSPIPWYRRVLNQWSRRENRLDS